MASQRILIADDERDIRVVLRTRLEQEGFTVLEAADGAEAVSMAQDQVPDLIVLDVMMPQMDGVEVCNRLRASFTTRHIPVIMVTALAGREDKLAGLVKGANDYVTKPFEMRELVQRVRNTLEWSRQQRSASPLTGLPGNASIDDEIKRRFASEKPFAMLQADIDYFKAFNDHYGYSRGDVAIQTLARILLEEGQRHGERTFVGHIGGDDFVMLTEPQLAEKIGRGVLAAFDRAVPTFYDPEDLQRGYVEVQNRLHVPERFPLMSLTLSLVITDQLPGAHLAQLADRAQELKARGKGIAGSVLVSERRSIAGGSEQREDAA